MSTKAAMAEIFDGHIKDHSDPMILGVTSQLALLTQELMSYVRITARMQPPVDLTVGHQAFNEIEVCFSNGKPYCFQYLVGNQQEEAFVATMTFDQYQTIKAKVLQFEEAMANLRSIYEDTVHAFLDLERNRMARNTHKSPPMLRAYPA